MRPALEALEDRATPAAAPFIPGPTATLFGEGLAAAYTVTATGDPAPTLGVVGALPAGVTFDPATGQLAGIAATGTTGRYEITLTATNSVATHSQPFALTVGTAPVFASNPGATFYSGFGRGFTVTTAGSPYPTITLTGTLPPGLTFTPANGFLSGTAAPGSEGTYPLTITADNGIGGPFAQAFTLDVQTGLFPGIGSPQTARFAAGVGGTFPIVRTGNPAPALSFTGTLPGGASFDATTGVVTVGPSVPAGTYTLTFTAASPLGAFNQGFALVVGDGPAFTSPSSAAFRTGQPGSFGVAATGFPQPTFAVTAGGLPPGVALDPSGLLAGTSNAAGVYPVTITATNGVNPAAAQLFVLTIGSAPAITSFDSVALSSSTGGTFAVSAVGLPVPALALAGTLPPGAAFDPATGLLTVAPGTPVGTYALTVTAANALGYSAHTLALTVQTAPVISSPTPLPPRLSVGGTPGGTAVFDPITGGHYATTPTATPNPFPGLGVVVRSATADVDGDGKPDTIAVTGPGTPVRFAVISGADNATLLVAPTAPFPGSESFSGGGYVSAGDVTGDGRADIVITPDQGGGPRVMVFSLPANSGLMLRADFLGIDDANFRGGARTAVGDVNKDGRPDVAVAAGFLGGPRAALFDGATLLSVRAKLVPDFFAFPGADAVTLRNGAFVALGDLTGDGFADVVFGGGPGGAPRVFVLSGALVSAGNVSGAQAGPVANFFVANDSADRGGVRVAAADANGDGRADLVAGSGAGAPARVRVYPGQAVTGNGEPGAFQDLVPFAGQVLLDGVYVG